ncbi:thermostable hemolysin [Variovorax sp. LT2P21]|uniref:thermostable hemolysin n=1 Tax=Variovorax sp. LT2P21 TaxID=3443731 RepID=UPI003F47E6F1
MAVSPHDGDPSPPAGVASERPALVVHGRDDLRRAEVEAFVLGIFAQRYGAQVQQFAPVLVSLQDHGEIVAAAGYRCAADAPLFLERYLSSPIETLLATQAATQPARRSVVEVGHLAASRAGEGRRLIALLGPHLAAQGFQWVVSTLTTELRQLFVRIGVTPLALGTADPAALGAEAAHWGSYYDHRPVVLAGHLGQALHHMARRAGAAKGTR